MTEIVLRRATEGDIDFICATERRPGYDALVGRFEADEHRVHLHDDDWLYVIGLDAAGMRRGFAILQDRRVKDGSEFLRRIAVVETGNGFGRLLLRSLLDWIFAETDADRVRLHVRKVNVRARHVYETLGFVPDPTIYKDGDTDSVSLVLARSAWQTR